MEWLHGKVYFTKNFVSFLYIFLLFFILGCFLVVEILHCNDKFVAATFLLLLLYFFPFVCSAHRNNNETVVHESNLQCKIVFDFVFAMCPLFLFDHFTNNCSIHLTINRMKKLKKMKNKNRNVYFTKRHHLSYRLTFSCLNHVRSCFRQALNCFSFFFVPFETFYQRWQAKKTKPFLWLLFSHFCQWGTKKVEEDDETKSNRIKIE